MNPFEEGDKNFQLTNVAQLQRWLPWLRMFRAFRIAIDYQKLVVALVAVLLWGLVSGLIADVSQPQTPDRKSTLVAVGNSKFTFAESTPSGFGLGPGGNETLTTLKSRATRIHWYYANVTRSILRLANFHEGGSWWIAWLQLLWGLGIAALFGGAISRMAAREFTGNSRSLIQDAKFSVKQFPATFGAPLIALGCFLMIWCLNWFAGLFGRIPVVGEFALAVMWGLFLLSGLILFLVLLGLVLGWPLMICSGSVEKNDTFDSLSRAFSYLLNRPWYAMFLAFIAAVYGSLTLLFVFFAVTLTVSLSLSSVAAGLGNDVAVPAVHNLFTMNQVSTTYFQSDAANLLLQFWIGLATMVPAAFAFSFFWTSTTIGYFLLRRREDGTPLHEIDLSDTDTAERPELAVVGIPAAEMREQQNEQ